MNKRKKPVSAAVSLPDVAQMKCDALFERDGTWVLLGRLRDEAGAVSSLATVSAGLMPQARVQATAAHKARLGSMVIPPKGSSGPVLLLACVLEDAPQAEQTVSFIVTLDNGKRGVGKATARADLKPSDPALDKIIRAYAPLLEQMAKAEGKTGGIVAHLLGQQRVAQAPALTAARSVPGPARSGPSRTQATPAATAGGATAVRSAPRLSPCEGKFDAIENGQARGWAFDPRKPAERMTIEIWAGDRMAGWGHADDYREDLQAAGKGNGSVAFAIDITRALRDGNPHLLQARLAGSGLQLGRATHTFTAHPAVGTAPVLALTYDDAQAWLNRTLQDTAADIAQAMRHAVARLMVDLENGRHERAQSELERLPREMGRSPVIHALIAQCCLSAGNLEKAAKAWQLLLKSSPDTPWPWMGLAEVARLKSAPADVERYCSEALRYSAGWNGLERRISQMRIKNAVTAGVDRLSAAQVRALIRQCSDLVLSNPDDRELTAALGVLMASGRPAQAASSLLDRHHCDASRAVMHWRTVLELALESPESGQTAHEVSHD